MTSITQKGQVTIPKIIREALGLRPGDEVDFDIDDDKAVLAKKLKKLPFEKWSGYLGKAKTAKFMEEIR